MRFKAAPISLRRRFDALVIHLQPQTTQAHCISAVAETIRQGETLRRGSVLTGSVEQGDTSLE